MERHFTRSMLTVVWTVSAIALVVWSLLAWGGWALLSDSGDWLFRLVEPWVASPLWDQRLDTLLAWGEQLGTVAVWGAWALGSVGLLLTSAFATLLYLRAQRALAAA
jgi:hypothetical protein